MTPRRIVDPARLAGSALLRTQTDERLVDLIRAGNLAAFDAVVRRYRAELLRYCNRLLPASRAEDAVQQTFMSAHAAVAAGSGEFALRAWLYRVAHNHAVTMLRQNGWDNDPLTEDAHGWGESPEAVHERGQDLRAMIDAVAGLPQRQRDALVLRELDGRSYEEIAEHLGVSGGAVRQLVMRARSTLRAGLSAVTPPAILVRLTDNAATAGATASVATVAAGAAGGAGFAQAGAAALAAAAIVAGAVGVTTTADTAGARPEHPQQAEPGPEGAAGNALPGGNAHLLATAGSQPARRAQEAGEEREGGRTRSARRKSVSEARDNRGEAPDSSAAADPAAQPQPEDDSSSRTRGGDAPERDDGGDDDDRGGSDDDESRDAADPANGGDDSADSDGSEDDDLDSGRDTGPGGDGADDDRDEEDEEDDGP